MEKFDKLGRRIPTFDRKAAAQKAQKTREEKYGNDYNKRIGALGARVGTRGYFGKLKDTDPEKLKEIAKEANSKSINRTPEERSESARKGWDTRRNTGESPATVRGDK